jgi:hypothetical protein
VVIAINTSENNRAANLLDFYAVSVSQEDGLVKVAYENIDQIPSICRILIDNNIEIFNVSIEQPNPIIAQQNDYNKF